ncbi:MAG: hypothetical protein ACYTFT_17665 [Planctomycetota bacterium]|jgi:hypothetical protein
MSLSGAGGIGHIGAAQSTRTNNTLSNIGAAAFDTVMSGATIAASAFGGPAAASAVSSFRNLAGSAVGSSGGSGGGSEIGQIQGDIQAQNKSNIADAGRQQLDAQSTQLQMFQLQSAVNTMSQTNTTMANMQKARHDAMMATVQAIR